MSLFRSSTRLCLRLLAGVCPRLSVTAATPGPLELSSLEPIMVLVPELEEDLVPISISMSRRTLKQVLMAESMLAALEGPALTLMTMWSIFKTLD